MLLWEIARRLDRSRFEPSFVLPDDGPLGSQFRTIGHTDVEPLYPREPRYWRELRRIGRRLSLLRRAKPDAVYCNTIHTAKWLVYAKMLGIPTITHIHELSMGFASVGRQEHLLIRAFSDRFIAVSHAVKRYLVEAQRIDEQRIDVIHAGIDVQPFARLRTDDALRNRLALGGALVVGTVGRITHMKGSDLMLDIVEAIRRQRIADRPVKFLIVATTDDTEFYSSFRSKVQSLGLAQDIVIEEDVRNVAPYYGLMDVYLSTAREDPFPLVVLEAMAAGLPVLAFATGGIPEALSAQSGILVDDLSVEKAAGQLSMLLGSRELRRAMGEAGRRRAIEMFDIGKNIAAFETVIDQALGRHSPRILGVAP